MITLSQLQNLGFTLEADGNRLKLKGPACLLTSELRQQIAESKRALLAQLKQYPTLGQVTKTQPEQLIRDQKAEQIMPTTDNRAVLERAIRHAIDWQDLEAALVQVQRCFEAGQLSQDEAECLAILVVQEARCLPEVAGGQGKRCRRLDLAAAEIGD